MSQIILQSSSLAPADWDEFLESSSNACCYWRVRWVEFAGTAFGFKRHYIFARRPDGALSGVLPLVHQRSLLFGSRLVSLPFFNYGGAIAADDATRAALVAASADLGRRIGARTVEIRGDLPLPGVAARTDKVRMVLALPGSFDELSKGLGAKLRSQVKRADRASPSVAIGGADLVDTFYEVFAPTMRDLGTPVYPRAFFHELFAACGADCAIVTVNAHGVPAAAALLVRHGNCLEVPWAASSRAFRAESVNMRLYWEMLRYAVETGCREFDFGRSTIEAGTYRFKLQWGAQPVQLHWLYPLQRPEAAPAAPGVRGIAKFAQIAWQRLPLPLANRLGPLLSPGLPW